MRNQYDYDTRSRDRDRDFDSSRDRERGRSAFFERDENDDYRSGRRERDPQFGSDAYHRGVPMDETRNLIASNKVEGTPVYGRDGDRLGSIHNFMVDKRRGRVVYAVLKSSGGFLGLGERYYPLDWDELEYDTRDDGYRLDMTEKDLKHRRSFDDRGREHGDRDREYSSRDRVYGERNRW